MIYLAFSKSEQFALEPTNAQGERHMADGKIRRALAMLALVILGGASGVMAQTAQGQGQTTSEDPVAQNRVG